MSDYKLSTKDQHEKDEEEAERLVRKSPKKKPPRRDKERGHIKTDDPDIGADTKDDKDLSMNYKDIGGSALARRVALRFVSGFDFDPDGNADNPDTADEEESEEESEDAEDVTPEPEPEPEPEKKELAKPDLDDIQFEAEKLYQKPYQELQDMLSDDQYTKSEQKALRQALALKTAPLPPLWDRQKVFEDGLITLKARRYFREHMANWDSKNFADNLTHFKERQLNESLTTGRQDNARYYEVMIAIVEKAWKEFQEEGTRSLQSLKDAMSQIENPESTFGDEDREKLKEQAAYWREQIRRTGAERIENILKESQGILSFSDNTDTVEYAWLNKLTNILKGALEMKKNSSEGRSIAASIRSGFSKAGQYRGLRGPLEDDDYYKPDSPKWRKPDPLDLTVEDYAAILREAKVFLKKPFLANDIAEFNPEMARRLALDYSIFTLEDGKYDSTVDTPTYNALLNIFTKVTEK